MDAWQGTGWAKGVALVVCFSGVALFGTAACQWIESARTEAKKVRVPVDKSADVGQITVDWFRNADTNGDGFVDGEELALQAPSLVTAIKDRLGEPDPEAVESAPDPESGQ